jgi:hypothetical protein
LNAFPRAEEHTNIERLASIHHSRPLFVWKKDAGDQLRGLPPPATLSSR